MTKEKDVSFGWTFIKKPWGHERILFRAGKVCVKMLGIKAGHRTSLQVHREKREVMMLMTGEASIRIEQGGVWFAIGEFIVIGPGQRHRIMGVAPESIILEMAYGDADDIQRIEDDYDRVKS